MTKYSVQLSQEFVKLPRNSSMAAFLTARIAQVQRELKYLQSISPIAAYELVKVEMRVPDTLTKSGMLRVTAGEAVQDVMQEEIKHMLFCAVAEGFAKSAEIEKFMYFRTVGELRTVGIQLYLKHDQ